MAEEQPEKYEKVVEVLYDDLMAWVIQTLRDDGTIPKDADIDFAFVPQGYDLAYKLSYVHGWKQEIVIDNYGFGDDWFLTMHENCIHDVGGAGRWLDQGFEIEQIAINPQAGPGTWAVRYVLVKAFFPISDRGVDAFENLSPVEQLAHCLSLPVGADGLPRNRTEYRVLEIDTQESIQRCRPRDWGYVFWGPWVLCARHAASCPDKEALMAFFYGSYFITEIDDSIGQPKTSQAGTGTTGPVCDTLADTITVETEGGNCFVIRDWDRTLRAYLAFGIETRYEGFEALNRVDISSYLFRTYLIPGSY